MSAIRLVIVDDHQVVRMGLKALLGVEADLQIVAEAGNAREALLEVERNRPDVAILDVRLPGPSGLELCRQIRERYPLTRVVMLTSYASEAFIFEALRAGASGYVLKEVRGEELVRAIRAAARGEMGMDPQVTMRMAERLKKLEKREEADAFRDLSQRELQVLALVARGQGNRQIGEDLGLSEVTVRNYVSTMLEKLALRNRVELATYAVQNRIFEKFNSE
ncbi:MAG: response regulator transcription factor [Anaerolineales bacterium]|jgi:DNA-binding NarL/FixJ family response regulator